MKDLKVERFLAALSASDFLLFAKLDVLMRVGSRVTTCNDPDESIAGLAEPRDTRGANSRACPPTTGTRGPRGTKSGP